MQPLEKCVTIKSAEADAAVDEQPTPAFTNLADLANYRLKSFTSNGIVSPSITVPKLHSNFIIPKLNMNQSPSYGSSAEGLTPHEISLKKIMEMRKLHISGDANSSNDQADSPLSHRGAPSTSMSMAVTADQKSFTNPKSSPLVDSTGFVVDLSAALSTKSDKVTAPIKIIPEVFEVEFVDCDLPATSVLASVITKDCEIDASAISDAQLTNRTHKTSSFGKILCSRFRCKRMPYVSHQFNPKHTIVPFAFNIPNIIRKMTVKRHDI